MRLLHLYHDIMNLYGDYANVSAVKRMLEKSGEEVTVDKLSLSDEASLSDYDFIFIGSGTEKNQKVVLKDIVKYKDALKDYIESGKVLLMTGNSFELLGDLITDGQGKEHRGLGYFKYETIEKSGVRMTSDIICTASFLDRPLVGFINKSSVIFGINDTLFHTQFGIGNSDDDKTEGIRYKNYFGTHLTGPVLMKNPHFLTYITALILGREPETAHLTYEQNGYETTLRKLSERAQG